MTTFIISGILLGAALLSYAVLHSFIILCFFMVIILVFLLTNCYSILIKKVNYVQELEKYSRYPTLKEDVDTIIRSYKSVEKREPYVVSLNNDSVANVFYKVKEQICNNINSAVSFCLSYDYVNKGSTSYLHRLADECSTLVSKLNVLFEEMIDVDNSVNDVDTSVMDDLVEALREIKNN